MFDVWCKIWKQWRNKNWPIVPVLVSERSAVGVNRIVKNCCVWGGNRRWYCCLRTSSSFCRTSSALMCHSLTASDNALPDCCNFASVKASEPKGRHLRPVPKLVSIRSAVIYDPFRSHLRGVKWLIYDRKMTCLRVKETSGMTPKVTYLSQAKTEKSKKVKK